MDRGRLTPRRVAPVQSVSESTIDDTSTDPVDQGEREFEQELRKLEIELFQELFRNYHMPLAEGAKSETTEQEVDKSSSVAGNTDTEESLAQELANLQSYAQTHRQPKDNFSSELRKFHQGNFQKLSGTHGSRRILASQILPM